MSLSQFWIVKHRAVSLSALSGILLTLAFPPVGWGFLIWIAFVPFFFAVCEAQRTSQALKCGAVTGIFFYCFSMHWLTQVSAAGWLLWAVIQTAYFVLFSWLIYFAQKAPASLPVRILWTALAWTVLEIVRADTPVFGVGWNLLAYSQAQYPVMIQSANIFGAYGLGFLIVIVNGCLFELSAPAKKRTKGIGAALFTVVLLIFVALLVYGDRILAEEKAPEEYLRVSVLQGNIPQAVKWEIMAKEQILAIYEKLTQLAALDQPDLIIWPEASFPGYFNRDVQAERISRVAKEVRTPLLVGALHWVSEKEVYNSAYFLDKDGVVSQQRYDKVRLVPFSEYIPLKFIFGWLKPVADALGISDFSAGSDSTVFQWAREEWPFGVLICFEDVFMDLARKMADRDAKFLVVITNDAWFGKTGAPYQHLQASIFRAVENGVAVVRAANTGISTFISRRGEVLATVKNGKGEELFTLGHKTLDLPLIADRTLYRRGGYFFPHAAIVVFLALGIFLLRKRAVS